MFFKETVLLATSSSPITTTKGILSLSAYLNLALIFLSVKNNSVLIPAVLKAVAIGKQGEISDEAETTKTFAIDSLETLIALSSFNL